LIRDVSNLNDLGYAPLTQSDTTLFMLVESGIRRLQRAFRVPYLALFDTYRFYEACSRCLPSYILCHEYSGLFSLGAALACWQKGIPRILTVEADYTVEHAVSGKSLRGPHALMAAWEARIAYKLAKKIITVSQPAKQHLVEFWQIDPEKIVVMPNGVDTDLFQPVYDPRPIRARLRLGDGPIICFVGGFQHWHGLDRLVESFARVLAEVPDAKLLLIGDGPVRPAVDQKIAELGLGSSVMVTGLIPQTRVPEMLAIADIAVLPYPQLPRELWFSPLKLFEYMAAGKAIVASRAGQITELIQHGHNGLLVEPGNIVDLAQAIIKLLNDPAERKRLGHNARHQAMQQHSWSQYICRLEEVYLSAIA
jgi:glycosyltransferase involved in cell wall biosynthesis